MNDEEMKKVIADIIYHTGCTGACCECEYSKVSEADTYCKALLKANALIAAGVQILPCKVGDKVYGVDFTDCEDRHATDPKRKREIFNTCVKMNGECHKCKYSLPAIEEFICTHIQIGRNGIEGSNILIVGEKNENYSENNVFMTRTEAEARLAELKGEQKR